MVVQEEGRVALDEGIKYKARLVAKGITQKEGVEYNEIFSQVVRYTSIRVLLMLCGQNDRGSIPRLSQFGFFFLSQFFRLSNTCTRGGL